MVGGGLNALLQRKHQPFRALARRGLVSHFGLLLFIFIFFGFRDCFSFSVEALPVLDLVKWENEHSTHIPNLRYSHRNSQDSC